VFTGLIEDVGRVEAIDRRGTDARLRISTALGPLVLGESVAVHGACLTVVSWEPPAFEVECSAETLAVTTLGQLVVGSPVHLERAMLAGSRLGGHIVSGHVDGLAELVEREAVGESLRLAFRVPASLALYVADKGSVCLDGVSLTVNRVEGEVFELMLIPHTIAKTTLARLPVGGRVNLETDILARYAARILTYRPSAANRDP
jgi:riboflavin synthase